MAANDHGRRTWDISAYESRANERRGGGGSGLSESQEKVVIRRPDGSVDKRRTFLAALPAPTKNLEVKRDTDFSARLRQDVNKVRLESSADDDDKTEAAQARNARSQSSFTCKECRMSYRDSIAYLDHLNSRGHQKRLGMKMTVERGSVEGVRERLARLKREREGVGSEAADKVEEVPPIKQARTAELKESVTNDTSPKEHDVDEMQQVMGLSSFGSTKR